MADRLGGGAAHDPVAAADFNRLAGEPNDPIHQVGIHLGPQKTVHAPQRTADDQTQMGHLEPFSDQPVHAVDHVVIAVVRETTFEPVRGFA
jgi:hypothetical protein